MGLIIDPYRFGDDPAAETVWNPSDAGGNIILSNSNRDAECSVIAWNSVRAAAGITSGKYYWEIKLEDLASHVHAIPGMMDGSATTGSYPGNSASSWGAQSTNSIFVNGVTRDYATAMPTFADNDIFMFAFDDSAGKAWMGVNGTWFNSGDPAAGTGSVCSAMTSGTWYPATGVGTTGIKVRIISNISSFTYSIPTGFSAYGLT